MENDIHKLKQYCTKSYTQILTTRKRTTFNILERLDTKNINQYDVMNFAAYFVCGGITLHEKEKQSIRQEAKNKS